MKRLLLVLGSIACCLLFARSAGAASIVINGGFETGDLTGWTCTDAQFCQASNQFGTFSGSFSLYGFENDGFGTLSQALTTVIGDTYEFDFWSALKVSEGSLTGHVLRYQVDGGSITTVPFTPVFSLTSASFVATAGVTPIRFFFETDQDPGGVWIIDDVSVESVGAAAVPEPGTLLLFGSGAVGVLARMRRRKQQ